MLGTSSLLALLASTSPAFAGATYYVLGITTPNGVNLTSFKGTMKTPGSWPGYDNGETYYLWPGIQGADTSTNPGVLQSVMSPDSGNGTWSEATGYYGANLPWGEGIAVTNGEEWWWDYQINSDNSWTCETGYINQGPGATDTFALQQYPFNQALWAIELYYTSWNFGTLAFYDTAVTWQGSDPSPCTNDAIGVFDGSFSYAVDGASATVNNNGTVTCYWNQVILWGPSS